MATKEEVLDNLRDRLLEPGLSKDQFDALVNQIRQIEGLP